MSLEYLAGLIDGEGHICRMKCKNGRGESYLESRIIVTNTSKPLMEALKRSFGGYYYARTKSKTNVLTCYNWYYVGKKAEALALELQPLLVVKAEQIKRIIS